MTELNLPRLRALFLELGLFDKPVIVHASLRAFGHIQGGADALLRALQESTGGHPRPDLRLQDHDHARAGPAGRTGWNTAAART